MNELTIDSQIRCYNCDEELEFTIYSKINRSDECPKCKVNLRCCRMCKFYDRSVYNECREPNAERILEKEKPNFCGYFALSDGHQDQEKEKEQQVSAANALFKD